VGTSAIKAASAGLPADSDLPLLLLLLLLCLLKPLAAAPNSSMALTAAGEYRCCSCCRISASAAVP